MNNKVISIIVLLVFVGGVVWLIRTPGKTGKLDAFATCIKDSGTLFHGAFWCPHCQNQKSLFGSSAKLLPYVECSTPDGNGMLPVCANKGIKSFPTWYLPDGTIHEGELSLAELSKATNCPLPVTP